MKGQSPPQKVCNIYLVSEEDKQYTQLLNITAQYWPYQSLEGVYNRPTRSGGGDRGQRPAPHPRPT